MNDARANLNLAVTQRVLASCKAVIAEIEAGRDVAAGVVTVAFADDQDNKMGVFGELTDILTIADTISCKAVLQMGKQGVFPIEFAERMRFLCTDSACVPIKLLLEANAVVIPLVDKIAKDEGINLQEELMDDARLVLDAFKEQGLPGADAAVAYLYAKDKARPGASDLN